jgi:ATP-binding cassette, subfamily B, multidrug efflux pump
LKALKKLNKYLWKYRKTLLWGFVFILITNVFNILAPYLVRVAFDYSLSEISLFQFIKLSDFNLSYRQTIITNAALCGFLILLVALLRGIFMFFMRQTIIVVSRKIEFDLKNEIYNHYQKLSLSFYRENFTGDLMSRISEDVSKVRMYLGPAIMYFVNLVFTFITVLIMMIAVNPKLTFWVLLPLPILSLSIYYVSEMINKKSDRIQAKLSDLTSFVQESMAGIRILKAFSVQHVFAKNFGKETENYRELSMSLTKINSVFMPLMMFLVGLSTLLTVYFGGLEVANGNFTYGNIAEFVIYINLLTWPVASLGWVTAIVQSAEASQARINVFLDTKQEVISGENKFDGFKNKIVLENITYSYPAKPNAIENINFTALKGQTIGIIGPTGSGKTTLLNLLARFFDPKAGTIWIDDTKLIDYNLTDYRNKIALVPQDVFLFSDSIYENIVFGSPEPEKISKTEVEKAAKIACVHKNISEFTNQYETILGERGITLSGGQKQRVAIARALIRNPEIILLDDCLSAVDQQTEKQIIQNLKSELQNKTAFISSHRLSALEDADIILVLDNGNIIAQGNHDYLIKHNTYYEKMYKKQMEEIS